MSKILGIDHGTKRIGIALSDETGTIAFAKEVIDGGKGSFKKIAGIVSGNLVTKIIVGYPLNMKGEKSKQTEEVDRFLDELRKSVPEEVVIEKWDERLTSKMAESFMIDSVAKKKTRQDKSNLDKLSAAFILQSYLDQAKTGLI